MKKITCIFITIALFAVMFSSCSKDVLEPTVAQGKPVEGSINTVDDVKSLLYGAYNYMTLFDYYGRDHIIYGEIRSDNCFSNANSGKFVIDAKMDYSNIYTLLWRPIYRVTANANIIIGLNPAKISGDAGILKHYIGQAYAIRALAYFDLLRYYGQMHTGGTLGIPYIKKFKSIDDSSPSRATYAENVVDIYADIETAISMMDPALDDPSKQLMTHYGAQALKSRVAIYFGDWTKAKTACEAVIGSARYSIIPGAQFNNSYRVKKPANSIFELAFSPTDNQMSSSLASIYRGSYGDIECLENLYLCFDAGDVRSSPDMIGPDPDKPGRPYVNLGKYPSMDYTDNVVILRYEEVILNYAEALWRINAADPNALPQLNLIPAQRNAVSHAAINENTILLERRREFVFEGMRFHDLMRTGRAIPLVDPFKQTHGGPAYGNYKLAFPIPFAEMNANPNMVQNTGY